MKFELKEYQETAAAEILKRLRKASKDYSSDKDYSSISLSAPTGAGKTVIATAIIERILYGDVENDEPADSKAVIVWLTDDPNLNEQTRKKILEASDKIQPGQLVTVTDSLNQPEFKPKTVYFLNIQKLGKNSNLTKRTDKRKHTIFDTIANSIRNNGGHYYLIVDEAHHGTGNKANAQNQTLTQKLISDAEGKIPPTPVVWGISATPERFDKAMASADNPSRGTRKVAVSVEDVKESGLIKDVLAISYKGEDQDSTYTQMRAAVKSLKDFEEEWQKYATAEDSPPVAPLLVLQIPPKYGDDQIEDLLNLCRSEWEVLEDDAIAHCMESHTVKQYGKHVVKYVEPQNIYDKQHIRLVIFKQALTTGWDCPRAEVMLSLQNAQDPTYIAQLIGRMVRTPLARRVTSNEALNRVRLFLPNFDTKAVQDVIAKFEKDEDIRGTTRIEVKSVDAWRNSKIDEKVFSVFSGLPSYVVPGKTHKSQISRLHKFATLLEGDGILPGAIKSADDYLILSLEQRRKVLENEDKLEGIVEDIKTADIASVEHKIHGGEKVDENLTSLDLDDMDLTLLFSAAGRKLCDGLAQTYWAYRVLEKEDEPDEARVNTVALSWDADTLYRVEDDAQKCVQDWFKNYGSVIADLSEDQKAKYDSVREMTKSPEVTQPALVERVTMSKEDIGYTQHLYSDKDGVFNTKLGTWEEEVLKVEQRKESFVAWYRNPVGGQRAVRVPYKDGDKWKKLYPDFIVFHTCDEGEVRPSIVDPHSPHLADATSKLRGLAVYAAKHADQYSRIVSVIQNEDKDFLFLDLKNETVRVALADIDGEDAIRAVFKQHGSLYK